MKQGYQFPNGKIAYSIEGLCRLCQENKNDALEGLNQGSIEQWLDSIGEKKLARIASQIRLGTIKSNNNNVKNNDTKKIKQLIFHLKRHINLNTIDINQSIEIALKEYEMLRNEIIFHFQNRTQLITLGLAAIFALAGLALAPLTDFLTAEKITLTQPVSVNLIIEENKNQFEININNNDQEENNTREELIIERTIREDKIAGAAIPSVIVLTWLIPIASIYIMYFYLNWTQQISVISEYISNRIEKKIYNLNFINPRLKSKFKITSQRNKLIATPLSWESFTKTDPRSQDVSGIFFTFILFSSITILSVIAGTIILYFDFKKVDQEEGYKEAVIKINHVKCILWNNLVKLWMNYHKIILAIIIVTIILVALNKLLEEPLKKLLKKLPEKLAKKISKFIKWLKWLFTEDYNFIWLLALCLLPFCFKLNLFRGIDTKDFWLFAFPISIWFCCLLRIIHQIMYTLQIRKIVDKNLTKEEYLKQLWS